MKKYLLIICFILTFVITKAQPGFHWVKTFGGTDVDFSNSVITDNAGNVYILGMNRGSLDFDPGPDSTMVYSTGFGDAFISKFDPFGNFLWVKIFHGILYQCNHNLRFDATGNLFFTGMYIHEMDLDPGPANNIVYCGNDAAFIIKLDTDGDFLWGTSIGNFYIAPSSMDIDASGNIYYTGSFVGTDDFDPGIGVADLTCAGLPNEDVFVSKLDSAGNYLWAKRMGALGSDRANSLEVDDSGNVYVTGFFNDAAEFFPDTTTITLTANGGQDIFLLKYDSNGVLLWASAIGGSNEDRANAVTLDSTGVYITGYFKGTADFNPDPTTVSTLSTVNAVSNCFIAKYDFSGNIKWARSFVGTNRADANSIYADKIGHIYITGYFLDSIDFDPGPSYFSASSPNKSGGFIVKLSDTGEFIWAAVLKGNNSANPMSTTVDQLGNVYTTGMFNGQIDFDHTAGVFLASTSAPWTDEDCFIHKMSPFPVGVNEIKYNSDFNLYPNPNNGTFKIQTQNNDQIIVTDILGKEILNMKVSDAVTDINLNVNAGLYLVKRISGNNESVQKLMISK